MSMNIDSLDKNYFANAAQNADRTAQQAKAAAGKDYSGSTDEELMDVCKKFEAYFIEQVLKEVKKTVPDNSLSNDGPTSSMVDFFMDSTIQKVSESLQEKQNLGLAQQMFEQMKRNYSPSLIPEAQNAGETEESEAVSETEEAAGGAKA